MTNEAPDLLVEDSIDRRRVALQRIVDLDNTDVETIILDVVDATNSHGRRRREPKQCC